MPVLCLGPVCIPLNVLLPALLGLAARLGLLRWLPSWLGGGAGKQPQQHGTALGEAAAGGQAAAAAAAASATPDGTGTSSKRRVVCEGDVCRFVQDDGDATTTAAATPQPTAAAAPARRQGGGLVGLRAVDL